MNIKNIKQNNGFITIELVLAFAILMINITGIILLNTSFSGAGTGYVINQGQLVAISNETNQEFIYKAQQQLEEKRVEAKNNFLSIDNKSTIEKSGPLEYIKNLIVSDLTPCKKKVTSEITWNPSSPNPQKIEFSTLFTDIAEGLNFGGDCETESPRDNDWKNPLEEKYNSLSFKTEGQGSGIDVLGNTTFLVTKSSGNNKKDFFIIDTTDIKNPILVSSVDISDGLEDIDIAGDYAFIANDQNKKTDQLVVVNISNINSPGEPIYTSLPGADGSCPNTCPGGRSIYYYKNKVYMGTHRLMHGGAAEFHIFDVSNPTSPVWVGSKGGSLGDVVDHNINDIIVRDQKIDGNTKTYAYLATSYDSGEFIILNVTDPSDIPNPNNSLQTGSILNLPGTTTAGERLDATILYIIGNRAYIGRERASGDNKDFFIIDISDPGNPSIIGSIKLGLNPNTEITGIRVSGNLAFIATNDSNNPFVVYDISNPSSILRWDVCGINLSVNPTDIDYYKNRIYLSLSNAVSNINFIIIEPTGGSCN